MNTWDDTLLGLLAQLERFSMLLCDAYSAQTEADIAMHGAILARQKAQKEIYSLLGQVQKHYLHKPLGSFIEPVVQERIEEFFRVWFGNGGEMTK